MQIIFSRIGQWCTLCLFNALLMPIPPPLAIDEVTASLQYLRSKQKPLFDKIHYLLTRRMKLFPKIIQATLLTTTSSLSACPSIDYPDALVPSSSRTSYPIPDLRTLSYDIEKSIRSYEKLITEHQDKIANPLKHYLHWNTLDSRRQDALINKRWPAEIQCYTEQKDILQTILDQRR